MLSLVRSRQVTVTVSIQSAAEAALPVETARLAGLGVRGLGFGGLRSFLCTCFLFSLSVKTFLFIEDKLL